MSTRTLQPSEYEIQREVEALKDIRRRSTTLGALTIDPDLPNQSPQSSPTSTYRSPKSRSPTTAETSLNGTSEESVSSGESSGSGSSLDVPNPNNPADDPFHLFWVPASVHPEIAPAEFRAFLKEHARNPATDGSDAALERATSLSSRSSLGRKRSMLSRQYQPKDGEDSDQEEKIVPLRRNRSYAQHAVPQLTISDLQKLEELAEEASTSDDPSKLRSVLRRSLSLNLSPTAIGQMDGMPDLGDEADVPIIVPPPGQILRRAARTKIRKPGLPGENQAHRFGSGRRGRRMSGGDTRTSVDQHSADGQTSESEESSSRRQTLSDDGLHDNRPDSFSEEASFIFDAYARDDDDDVHPPPVPPIPGAEPLPPGHPSDDLPPHTSEIQPALLEALGPIINFDERHTEDLSQTPKQPPLSEPSRTPSPETAEPAISAQEPSTPSPEPPVFQPVPPSAIIQPSLQQQLEAPPFATPQQSPGRKEKDKTFLFKWGSDKGGKKGKGSDREKEKEKEKGFFGSLFGGKKKQDESAPAVNAAGREAAHALLGASKSSKSYVPPNSPGLAPGVNNFSRYPIHVERAIYRLSHIKLANPRRPLYEQVLISNLMFWYLGVINKAQSAATATGVEGAAAQADKEKEEKEKEEKEKAEKERIERERLEKEREAEIKKKESGKRGSLTKTPAGGAPGGRRAEMPVKGPQYGMQQQVMQKEYSNGCGLPGNRGPNPPNGHSYPQNPSSAQSQQLPSQQHAPQAAPYPPGSPYPPQQIQPQVQQQYGQSPPRQNQPQMKGQGQEQYYYDSSGGRGGLPPGAMPPANMGPGATPGQSRSMQMNNLSSQQQQSPNRGYPGGMGAPQTRSPGRSLSANAVPSGVASSSNVLRKGNSARAAIPHDPRRPSEEEDMPLAVYQQQHRR